MKLVKKKIDKMDGVLCRCGDGTSFLRVYDKDYNFVDYTVLHPDLSVTIHGDDVSIYENSKGQLVIDCAYGD